MTPAWQCGVCEGINQGGTSCNACGADIPPRTSLDTSMRAPLGTPDAPPAPVPRRRPNLRRRRAVYPPPVPVEVDPYGDPYGEEVEWDVRPMPGGCLFSLGPRRR